MAKEREELTKRYYTIGEVAEMFDVSKSLIRFWENEFDSLKPHKNSKGDRRFTPQNIDQVRVIYELVKERGFTLEGAKREMKSYRKSRKEKQAWIEKLTEVRDYLTELKKTL